MRRMTNRYPWAIRGFLQLALESIELLRSKVVSYDGKQFTATP